MKSRGVADVFKWWTFMATDVIGELSFGESFRMLEHGKVSLLSRLQEDGRTDYVDDRKTSTSRILKVSPL